MFKIIGVILINASFLVLSTLGAEAASVVVPNANTAAPGNTDNRFPFLVSGGQRYQQVFAASQFGALGGPALLTEMDLRNGILVDVPFSTTISNIQISLCETPLLPDGLSPTFASNTCINRSVVDSGSLSLSSSNAAGPGGTHVFDVAIPFLTPYLYDPTLGNLLLDVTNFSGASSFVGSDFFDAQNTVGDSVSRVFGPEGNSSALSGTADSLGLTTRFQFSQRTVPEPASLALVALGLAGIAALRRRRQR